MYAIAFCGAVMVGLSAMMVYSPSAFSRGIIRFSEKSYFHVFEITSRLAFGSVYLAFAAQTRFPTVLLIVGYVHLFAGLVLVCSPPTKHREFAVWSAVKFLKIFRLAGLGTFFFGFFIIYAALAGSVHFLT